MAYSIDWSTATVTDGTLRVELSERPQPPWTRLFGEVVSEPIAGVSYSLTHVWGPPRANGETIWAANVIDEVFDEVKNTLEAAVAKTNERFEAYQKQAERDSAAEAKGRSSRPRTINH